MNVHGNKKGTAYRREEAEKILALWQRISPRLKCELDPIGEAELRKDIEALAIATKAIVVEEEKIVIPKKDEKLKYEVYVDDNFHYRDEEERYKKGEYDTEEEAVAVMTSIIDECIVPVYESKPDISAEDLLNGYQMFGDTPFCPISDFSAWAYAKQLCNNLCKKE